VSERLHFGLPLPELLGDRVVMLGRLAPFLLVDCRLSLTARHDILVPLAHVTLAALITQAISFDTPTVQYPQTTNLAIVIPQLGSKILQSVDHSIYNHSQDVTFHQVQVASTVADDI
jgi:hypothetical protein